MTVRTAMREIEGREDSAVLAEPGIPKGGL
jgi:hypothetical protein